jgi:enamidase
LAETPITRRGDRKLAILNVGLILSGMLEEPMLDGDCIVAQGGVITAVGRAKDVDIDDADILCAVDGGWIRRG